MVERTERTGRLVSQHVVEQQFRPYPPSNIPNLCSGSPALAAPRNVRPVGEISRTVPPDTLLRVPLSTLPITHPHALNWGRPPQAQGESAGGVPSWLQRW